MRRELFRRAAQVRGSDDQAYARLADFALLRMRAPVVRGIDDQIKSVTCSGTAILELPPGVEVAGGRIHHPQRRAEAGGWSWASASEVLAHECGHTWQARRMGSVYLPLVGSVTLCREGPRPWNRFENEASEQGLFGGIVDHSVCAELMKLFTENK